VENEHDRVARCEGHLVAARSALQNQDPKALVNECRAALALAERLALASTIAQAKAREMMAPKSRGGELVIGAGM
jgi:uncharacterized protein YciW